MSENSKIEWTDHTFNIRWGCTKVSDGCKNCYAETLDHRYGGDHWGPGKERKLMSDSYWLQPLKWDKAASANGVRQRVFCSSMADVFEDVDDGQINVLWELIRQTPHLDWLLLTKRPENIKKFTPADWASGYPNVWLGVSVENQKTADERVPLLLDTPAAVRFLSCEPLLGSVDIKRWTLRDRYYMAKCEYCGYLASSEFFGGGYEDIACPKCFKSICGDEVDDDAQINWVIAGGESGPKARPMHPEWARSLRNQCQHAGVPFFFKQWGEWLPAHQYTDELQELDTMDGSDSRFCCADWDGEKYDIGVSNCWGDELSGEEVYRVGKKKAGRLLDGLTWDEMPEPPSAHGVQTADGG